MKLHKHALSFSLFLSLASSSSDCIFSLKMSRPLQYLAVCYCRITHDDRVAQLSSDLAIFTSRPPRTLLWRVRGEIRSIAKNQLEFNEESEREGDKTQLLPGVSFGLPIAHARLLLDCDVNDQRTNQSGVVASRTK